MSTEQKRYPLAFSGLTILFFMWGFITVMNDVLINTFDDLFHLSDTQLSFIQMAFFGSFFVVSLVYFLISSFTGKDPINRLGYKNGMGLSLLICGAGCGIAYLAALSQSYPQFIVSLFVLAFGVTLLQICANPYATILGPEKTSSSRLNLAQGFNSLGTTVGPIVGNLLIFSVFSNGEKSIDSVGKTYLCYGIIFIIMSVLVMISKLPPFTNKEKIESGFGVLKNRHLVFGIIAIFFYVGSEVSVGSWIGRLAEQDHIMGMDDKSANVFLAFFWGGLMIGRLMASFALNDKYKNSTKYLYMALTSVAVFGLIWTVTGIKDSVVNGELQFSFEPLSLSEIKYYLIFMALNLVAFIAGKGNAPRLIVIFSLINVGLLSVGILSSGETAFWAILGMGLFFSIGWSNIFSLSIKGLGKLTSQGSSLLIMAVVGGAILPFFQAQVSDVSNVQVSFIVPLLGMFYLIFFGLYGFIPNTSKSGDN